MVRPVVALTIGLSDPPASCGLSCKVAARQPAPPHHLVISELLRMDGVISNHNSHSRTRLKVTGKNTSI